MYIYSSMPVCTSVRALIGVLYIVTFIYKCTCVCIENMPSTEWEDLFPPDVSLFIIHPRISSD